MPSSVRVAALAFRRAGALDVRYRPAAGVGEEEQKLQAAAPVWSKPVNLMMWGLVQEHIEMAPAFAELGHGVVVHTCETVSDVGTISTTRTPFDGVL